MARHYFHVKRGRVIILDQEGIELPKTADAEEVAVRRAQKLKHGLLPSSIIVANENAHTVFEWPRLTAVRDPLPEEAIDPFTPLQISRHKRGL
jgi:hypothetical protein